MSHSRFALLLPMIILAGCATLQNETAPKVRLVNIHPEEVGVFEQRYVAELRVINRAPEPLEMNGIAFSLAVNGRDFADGVSDEQKVVPALTSAKVDAELSSSLFGIVNQIMAMANERTPRFHYRISGRLYTSGSAFGIPFSSEDEIVLEQPVGAVDPERTGERGQTRVPTPEDQ